MSVFQAFRARFGGRSLSGIAETRLINYYPSIRVPCGPVRSSYAAAYEDVKRAHDAGYESAVRVIDPYVSI